MPEVMDQNGDPAPGIVTTQDGFAISWTADDAKDKVRRLLATSSEEEARGMFRLCSQSQWSYQRAKEELPREDWETRVCPVYYRPFDIRCTVWDSNVAVHRRLRVMRHLRAGPTWHDHFPPYEGKLFSTLRSRTVSEAICLSPKTSNNGFAFPLHL